MVTRREVSPWLSGLVAATLGILMLAAAAALTVAGVVEELSINLGVGQVTADFPIRDVRSVRLDAGIGEAALRLPAGWVESARHFLIGSEISWDDGRGPAVVRANVGVGEVEVRLE